MSLFEKYQKEIFHTDFKVDLSEPDYHTAAKYAYVLSQVWSGTNPEKAKFIDLKGKYTSKFDSFRSKLTNAKWQSYFDKIDITENLDFQDVEILKERIRAKLDDSLGEEANIAFDWAIKIMHTYDDELNI